mgnify:FL=1
MLITIGAALCLVFSGAALAQDEAELPTTQAECEAAGYTWLPEDIFGFGDPAQCGGPEWEAAVEAAAGEQTPAESAASADLPATEPAAAQQGSPQYTG